MLLIPTAFTMHYAHNYYVNMRQQRVLQFPDQPDEPLYSDFLYFSFTIAVASQTADIAVAGYQIRQVVLIQSILSFLFNTSLIGLTINIASGLIG